MDKKGIRILKFEKEKTNYSLTEVNKIYRNVQLGEETDYRELSSLLYYADNLIRGMSRLLEEDIHRIEDKYFQKEVDNNYFCICCAYLAGVYFSGLIVPRDEKKTIHYLKWASKEIACYDAVMSMLCVCYYLGFGVEEDKTKARLLLKQAKKKVSKMKPQYYIGDRTVMNMEI